MEDKKPALTFSALRDAKLSGIRANRADFRKKMKSASKEAKGLYKRCLAAIRRNQKRKGLDRSVSLSVKASTPEVALEASGLLNHPRNGYSSAPNTVVPSLKGGDRRVVYVDINLREDD